MSFELNGTIDSPNHFSVGAIVFRGDTIALIHKQKKQFTLPTETVYLNESLESALKRGMREELGIQIHINRYLGGIVSMFERDNITIEKITIYFDVKYAGDDIKSLAEDERTDEVVWVDLPTARKLLTGTNLRNEIQILERIKGERND